MKRNRWNSLYRWFSIPLLAFLVAGCEIKTETNIFTADLLEVIDTGTVLQTSSQLIIEIPSSGKCAETTGKLLPMLQGTFGEEVTGKGCHDEGMSSYIAFGLTLPIYLETTEQKGDSPIAIVISKQDDWHKVQMAVNVMRMDNLARMISDEFFQSVDFSTAKSKLNISNDLRQSVTIRIRGAFVNGDPVQEYTDYTLDRRDELDVMLSNVGSAMVFGKGQSTLFLIQLI